MIFDCGWLQLYAVRGLFWFRVCGAGIAGKDTHQFPLTFSERKGYVRHIMVGAWSFKVI